MKTFNSVFEAMNDSEEELGSRELVTGMIFRGQYNHKFMYVIGHQLYLGGKTYRFIHNFNNNSLDLIATSLTEIRRVQEFSDTFRATFMGILKGHLIPLAL